jgi:hypothetical protein
MPEVLTPVLRVVTVASGSFLDAARRLARSLERSDNDYRLTVYCDDPKAFDALAGARCELIAWRAIAAWGAKRAKPGVWAHALASGPFVYLDADAIVLEALDAFSDAEAICACPDELSQCDYIADRAFPWPNAPQSRNEVYVNSGVLYFPVAARWFLEHIAREAADDARWEELTFRGRLYDNHYFCAQLNLLKPRLRLFDPRVYDWQGLLNGSELQVVRRGNSLVNCETGERLRIAIFAGVRQSLELLTSFPIDVSSLLCERLVDEVVSPADGVSRVLAAVSPQLSGQRPVGDEHAPQVARVLLGEGLRILSSLDRSRHQEDTYFADPPALRAIAFANPDPTRSGTACTVAAHISTATSTRRCAHWFRLYQCDVSLKPAPGRARFSSACSA